MLEEELEGDWANLETALDETECGLSYSNVVEVIRYAEVDYKMLAIVRLRDGSFASINAICDDCGWDCEETQVDFSTFYSVPAVYESLSEESLELLKEHGND